MWFKLDALVALRVHSKKRGCAGRESWQHQMQKPGGEGLLDGKKRFKLGVRAGNPLNAYVKNLAFLFKSVMEWLWRPLLAVVWSKHCFRKASLGLGLLSRIIASRKNKPYTSLQAESLLCFLVYFLPLAGRCSSRNSCGGVGFYLLVVMVLIQDVPCDYCPCCLSTAQAQVGWV